MLPLSKERTFFFRAYSTVLPWKIQLKVALYLTKLTESYLTISKILATRLDFLQPLDSDRLDLQTRQSNVYTIDDDDFTEIITTKDSYNRVHEPCEVDWQFCQIAGEDSRKDST